MAKLIDPMKVLYSRARGQKHLEGDQLSIINGFNSLLPAVGWTKTANHKATATLDYATGLPTVDGGTSSPHRVVGCQATAFLSVDGVSFQLYDPGREDPAPFSQCVFVPAGTTPIATLGNLATAVTTYTTFNAAAVDVGGGVFQLQLESAVGGPANNFAHVQGDGRYAGIGSDAGNAVGGGYTFESNDDQASLYSVKITGGFSNLGKVFFDFSIDSGPAQYIITTGGPGYTLLANGYGFCLFAPGEDGSYPFISRSLFVMAPAHPAEEGFAPSTYGVFILGPRTFRAATYWYGSGGLISTAQDAPPATYSNTGGWPRLLALRSPGPPLHTPNDKPLVHAAYVMFGKNSSSGADVMGKLWDCAVVTDVVAQGATIDGQTFITIASQGGSSGQTASTLVMFGPPAVADPDPPAVQPPYPDTQPSTRSGTCLVPSTGFVVLGLTGSFTGLPHLSPITIAGAPYLVDAVQSPNALTLTDIITPHTTPVKWTVP